MTPNSGKPTWYILGAGAIGCLWASYWRQAGFSVVLITPSERKQSYIELDVQGEKTQIEIDHITLDQLASSTRTIDHLLVSTKAQHTLDAINAIKNTITKQATLLVLQNGMAAKQLPALLATQTIITAITTDGAYRTGQQAVVHAGHGITHIGCPQTLLQYLPTPYLTIKNCEDIEIRQWKKLAINCGINGLTAIYQCRNGELLEQANAQQRIQFLCNEVSRVANAVGILLTPAEIFTEISATLRTTAENFSSMYQDIHNGRSTEIDFINGYLCELAQQYHLSCEENKRIVSEIKQLQHSSADSPNNP